MKSHVITETGIGKEIEMPEVFSSPVRQDICQKVYESEKSYQPFGPNFRAGRTHSASGITKRVRKAWKTGYGHGMSRTPRKIIWRRGTQFNWIGAEVANTVGGRRAHPPRVEHFQRDLKINKKEWEIALNSGIAASTKINYLKKRYSSLDDIKMSLPIILSSDLLKLKTGKFFEIIEKNVAGIGNIIFKEKTKRAGKGKMKGRKYRTSAGMLFVISDKENFKINAMDVRKVSEIEMSDLYPLGRLVAFSENAIKELGVKK